VIMDQNAEQRYYQVWNYVMLALQALFVKTITTPSANAQANLALKVIDLVLKFYLQPHVNKEAYVDDVLAQILNVLQVGVLWQFIKDKTGGLVGRRRQAGGVMKGIGGDLAAQYFVGGALAGIIPPLVTAMYECLKSLLKLRRKSKKAYAKADDAQKDAKMLASNDPSERAKVISKRILNEDNIKKAKKYLEEKTGVGGDMMAQVDPKKVEQVALLLVAGEGKQVFKAAKEFKTQFTQIRNLEFEPTDPRSEMMCLNKALQKVAAMGEYKNCFLSNDARPGLLQLLGLPAQFDLNDLKEKGPEMLAENLGIDPMFVKVMTLCMEFDPEKGKEYVRKADLVLFKLPWPAMYNLQQLKDFVLGQFETKNDEKYSKADGMLRIRVQTEGEDTSTYEDVAPGSKFNITQAPVRLGIDVPDRLYGVPTVVATGMPVRPGDPGYAEQQKLVTEPFYTWTPEVRENPLAKAHVARTVEVNLDRESGSLIGSIDEGFRQIHDGHLKRPPMAPAQPYMSPGFGPQLAAPYMMPMGGTPWG